MFTGDKIYNPANWSNMQAIHETFARLRESDPVHFCESASHPDLWLITKHSDIFAIEKASHSFLNEPRSIIATREDEERTRALTGGSLNRIRHLLTYDGDEHSRMRRLTQSWFMPKNLVNLTGTIEYSARLALDAFRGAGGRCNFAEDVAMEYPFRVIMRLLCVPEEDHARILRAALILFGAEDPKVRARYFAGQDDMDVALTRDAAIADFMGYMAELTAKRMAEPKDDLATLIANAEIKDEPVPIEGKLGYFIIISTAGHDTTSYTLTEAVHQLARDPQLFQRLKADPDVIAPKITEEALRYAAPVRHFIRTAIDDFELRGKTIRKGDGVVLWYPSGSRDEDVFSNSNMFDIDRSFKTTHASLGHGAHMCLGQFLARMEITVFLKAFAHDVRSIQLTDEPTYSETTLVGGINDLPLQVEFA